MTNFGRSIAVLIVYIAVVYAVEWGKTKGFVVGSKHPHSRGGRSRRRRAWMRKHLFKPKQSYWAVAISLLHISSCGAIYVLFVYRSYTAVTPDSKDTIAFISSLELAIARHE